MEKEFSKLEESLNVKFTNPDLLKQAFVHRSFLNENPGFGLGHNERLEFLGDAVLELVVTDYLFGKYPDMAEGEMTNLRAALVNAQTLAQVAEGLCFSDFLYLSRGEAKENGRGRHYILANTFEAFVGAVYLDQGYNPARDFISKFLLTELAQIIENKAWRDAKSLFQESAQDKVGITPTYEVLEENGPDHAKTFTIGVFLGDELVAKGKGSSKSEAQQQAAEEAIIQKGW